MIESVIFFTGVIVWILIFIILGLSVIPTILFVVAYVLLKADILHSLRRKIVEVLEDYINFIYRVTPKRISI